MAFVPFNVDGMLHSTMRSIPSRDPFHHALVSIMHPFRWDDMRSFTIDRPASADFVQPAEPA
jgi:hypothetical protein